MAKTAMKIKQQRKAKFSTREYTRCRICGRPHAYLRKYGICRICFRSWHTKVRSRVLRKLPGRPRRKQLFNHLNNIHTTCKV